MFKKYKKTIFIKLKRYDKKATNPFLENTFEYNPFKSIYEQTYIWIENNSNTS